MANHYRQLKVWQLSMDVVTDIYKMTQSFPKEEMYGLTAQIRRCAVSIPSNIAEGAGRETAKEFMRFIHIASGSTAELDTQLLIAKNLGYSNELALAAAEKKIIEISKMLFGLLKSLNDKTLLNTNDSLLGTKL